MPELIFKGKEFVYNHHRAVPFRPLVPHAKKSVGKPQLNGNLIVHEPAALLPNVKEPLAAKVSKAPRDRPQTQSICNRPPMRHLQLPG